MTVADSRRPPWAVIIRDWLQTAGLPQSWLAVRTGVSDKHLCQVLTGKVPLSVRVAVSIERATGLDAERLLTLQTQAAIRQARQRAAHHHTDRKPPA